MSIRITRRSEGDKHVSYVQLPLSLYQLQCRRIKFLEGLHHGKLAEYRVAELCGGEVTEDYADPIDVVGPGCVTRQVKNSRVRPGGRWSFSNARTTCDYLVLEGEKDHTFAEQYLDDSPWVYWRVPHDDVAKIVGVSGYIQISTNPDVRSNIRMRVYLVAEIEISNPLE